MNDESGLVPVSSLLIMVTLSLRTLTHKRPRVKLVRQSFVPKTNKKIVLFLLFPSPFPLQSWKIDNNKSALIYVAEGQFFIASPNVMEQIEP